MLTHLKRLELTVRVQAVVNILLLTLLTVYICRVIAFEYLDASHGATSQRSESAGSRPTGCWFLWLTICLFAAVILPLQLVGDVALMRDGDDDTLSCIQKFEQWLRISALFLLVVLLGVFLAVFCPPVPPTTTTGETARPPIGGLVLISLLIASRVGALQTGRVYKSELEAIVESGTTRTTWETGPGSSSGGDCRSSTPILSNVDPLFIT